ncbi:MAG: hypothetical protein ACI4JB_07250 [Porcipelethomonas sp.]
MPFYWVSFSSETVLYHFFFNQFFFLKKNCVFFASFLAQARNEEKKKIGIVYYGLSEKVTRFVLAAESGRKNRTSKK